MPSFLCPQQPADDTAAKRLVENQGLLIELACWQARCIILGTAEAGHRFTNVIMAFMSAILAILTTPGTSDVIREDSFSRIS